MYYLITLLKLLVLPPLITVLLFGCSGGSGSSNAPSSTTVIGGSVVKGIVSNANITIYALKSDGLRGSVITTTTTDVSGNWSANISTFPIEAVATGGSYIDESSGITSSLTGAGICTFIPSGRTQNPITPLTTSLATRIRNIIPTGKTLAQSIAQAETESTKALGFNPASTTPPDPLNVPANATVTEKKYAAILLGLDELANTNALLSAAKKSVGALAILQRLADDIMDGTMNGVDLDGNGINVTVSIPLPAMEPNGVGIINTAAQVLVANKGIKNLGTTTIVSTPAINPVRNWDKMKWGQAWN